MSSFEREVQTSPEEVLAEQWRRQKESFGVIRDYRPEDVLRLRGSILVRQTLAERGAQKFRRLLVDGQVVRTLGALTGNQALQVASAGLSAVYLSGWQVAADNNSGGQVFPDQSLYCVDSVPRLARAVNQAFQRADQIEIAATGSPSRDWFLPLVADAEAGFGGILNAYELCRALIESGVAAIHLEDQLSSAKKCGHLGGKVVVPTSEFVRKLRAARLAADVSGVETLVIARTDALSAKLLNSDVDERDAPFVEKGERTPDGFFPFRGGMEAVIARGIAYAPYADLLWFETGKPDLAEAKRFADAIHEKFPGKFLAYNCSPSFNWRRFLSSEEISEFQAELGKLGYLFQFVTLAGFHALNASMYELATDYAKNGMAAYDRLQQREFRLAELREDGRPGYLAVRHQEFVGTGYFDAINELIAGDNGVSAMSESTERQQFS
ncbi:MAG: isocitrate lyase [Sulfobacillus sp.]